jgi:protein gp37
MSANTGIQWTDATWNPIRGCSRVSEGCRNCYAEVVAARFSKPGQPYEGLARRTANGGAHWTGKIMFVEKHLEDPLRWRKPRRIFVNSMSDLFHEGVTLEQLYKIFAVMMLARQHTFQILTKRPERMRAFLTGELERPLNGVGDSIWFAARALVERFPKYDDELLAHSEHPVWPLRNVWCGVSVEDQKAANLRIPQLLNTPAAVRFLSCEPLLAPVDLVPFLYDEVEGTTMPDFASPRASNRGLSWVIIARLPIVFARFRKERQRTLVGFALFAEAAMISSLPARIRHMLKHGRSPAWRAVVFDAIRDCGGEASLEMLYRAIEGRRPTSNPHWKAKVRQVVHCYAVRVGPSVYRLPENAAA